METIILMIKEQTLIKIVSNDRLDHRFDRLCLNNPTNHNRIIDNGN